MENQEKHFNNKNSKNNINHYLTILNKVIHKPLLIENIFTFIRNRPFIFSELIENDKIIKDKLNLIFSSTKKANTLNEICNKNINILLFYKIFKERLFNEINYINFDYFEDYTEKHSNCNPSFIKFYSNYIFQQITEENEQNKKKLTLPSCYETNDILYQLYQKKFPKINLVYLPKKNKINQFIDDIYDDGLYIEDVINNPNYNQEINILFCIIDDNEFYNRINPINDNIVINKLYFIYIKSNKNKDLNIYHSIKSYLKKINHNNVREIIFGKGFFKEEATTITHNQYAYYKIPIIDFLLEEVFLNKKSLSLLSLEKITLNFKNEYCKIKLHDNTIDYRDHADNLKLLLGLSLLFKNDSNVNKTINFDEVKIIDSKYYLNNICEKDLNKQKKENTMIIKIHNFSFLTNKNFMNYIYEYLDKNTNIISIILYISEEIIKYGNIDDFKIASETFYLPLKDQNFLFYSELPIKVTTDNYYGRTKIESNKGLLLSEKLEKQKTFIEKLHTSFFLFKKYKFIIMDYENIYKESYIFIYNKKYVIIYSKQNNLNEIGINLIKYCIQNLNSKIIDIHFLTNNKKNFYYFEFDFNENIKQIYLINIRLKYIIGDKNRNKVRFIDYEGNSNSSDRDFVLNYISYLDNNKKKSSGKKTINKNKFKNLKEEDFYENEDDEYYDSMENDDYN